MKNSIICFILTLTLLSCKEAEINGLFDLQEVALLDSCYKTTGSIPVEPKRVALFDITGVRCVNCPKAAEIAKTIQANNPNLISVIGLHANISGLELLVKPWDGFPIVNNIFSTEIVASNGNPNSLPQGYIDFKANGSSKLFGVTLWTGEIINRLKIKSTINMSLKASIDLVKDEIIVESKNIFNTLDAEEYSLIVGLTENDIVSKQSDSRASSGHIDDYKHEHVIRHLFTSIIGSPVCKGVNEIGSTCEKHFKTKIKSEWKKADLSAFAYIINTNTKEVLQITEIKL